MNGKLLVLRVLADNGCTRAYDALSLRRDDYVTI